MVAEQLLDDRTRPLWPARKVEIDGEVGQEARQLGFNVSRRRGERSSVREQRADSAGKWLTVEVSISAPGNPLPEQFPGRIHLALGDLAH